MICERNPFLFFQVEKDTAELAGAYFAERGDERGKQDMAREAEQAQRAQGNLIVSELVAIHKSTEVQRWA